MIPERFAIEMVRRGWILRNKIVWHKPNHLPESVKDRFAQSWEYVFLFSKSSNYYFNLDAVRVPHVSPPRKQFSERTRNSLDIRGRRLPPTAARHPNGKNPGDCWSLTTTPFPEAHFAVYPEKLCVRPILAGCPRFVCAKCGTPKLRTGNELCGKVKKLRCQCGVDFVPGVVLDPFMGAGTTAVVAKQLGRNFIGFELNPEYVKIANRRLRKTKPDQTQKRKGGTKAA